MKETATDLALPCPASVNKLLARGRLIGLVRTSLALSLLHTIVPLNAIIPTHSTRLVQQENDAARSRQRWKDLWSNCAECWYHTPPKGRSIGIIVVDRVSTVGCQLSHSCCILQCSSFLYWRLCKNSFFFKISVSLGLQSISSFSFLQPTFVSHFSTDMHKIWYERVLPHAIYYEESDFWKVQNQKPGHIGKKT